MGEGKISIFSPWFAETYGVGEIYPSCVVCSRIAFDSNLQLKDGKLENVDILKYMLSHKMPNQEVSYYEYLAKEKGDFSVKNGVLQIPEKPVTPEEYKKALDDLNSLDPKKYINTPTINNVQEAKDFLDNNVLATEEVEKNPEAAILFMQISAPGYWNSLGNIARDVAIGGAAGHFMSFGATTKLVTTVATRNPIFTGVAAILGIGTHAYFVFSNQNIAAGYCGDISTGSDARMGCSVVRVVNYDAEDIKQYCSVIESIS